MADAVDWPEGYVVYENTASPDGRYGVLVPTVESWEQDEALETAYGDLEQDLEHTTYQNEEDKAESLDQRMNTGYRAAQFCRPHGLPRLRKSRSNG